MIKVLALLFMLVCPAFSANWYVATTGVDTNAGTLAAPFKTIGHGVGQCNSGDTVIVSPGLYPPVGGVFYKAGTVVGPVTIKSTQRPTLAKATDPTYSVIISSGNNGAPSMTTSFMGHAVTRTNTGVNNIYSAPCAWTPKRCTYNNTVANGPFDLFPYFQLSDLQALKVSSASVQTGVYPAGYSSGSNPNGVVYPTFIPGPHGGFYANGTTLYVRLDPSYCTNVNPGDASNRLMISGSGNFDLSLSDTRGNFIVDGIAFDGGVNGVTVKGPNCTVQNCVFTGCVTAIDCLNNNYLTVQNNEFSAYPCFNDAVAAYADQAASPSSYQDPSKHTAPWSNYGIGWAHKLPPANNYELAFIRSAGTGCIVQWNNIHDGEDGLSSYCTSNSTSLSINNNLITNESDNGVECESTSNLLLIYKNLFKNCFEPISWQPNGPPPFPTATTIAHNVIYDTPGILSFWQNINTVADLGRCIFKIMVQPATTYPGGPGTVPANIDTGGVLVENNTLFMNWGEVFHWTMPYTGTAYSTWGPATFINNLIVDQYPIDAGYRDYNSTPIPIDWSNINFQNNVVASPTLLGNSPGVTIAGKYGYVSPDIARLNLTDPFVSFNFVPTVGSYLVGKGEPVYNNPSVPSVISLSSTVGAYNVGDTMPAASMYGVQPGAL